MTFKSFSRLPLLLRSTALLALVALIALGVAAGPNLVNAQEETAWAIGDYLVVNTDALNLRDDASTGGSVLAVLETGATAIITDGPVSADGYTWYYITSDAGDGWVAGELLAPA